MAILSYPVPVDGLRSMQTTNPSLLIRLAEPSDEKAWYQFVDLYQPAIVRSLRFRGLRETDAEDVAQHILLGVAKALRTRPHDHTRAKFRTWLEKVIRNAALNSMRSARADKAVGGTDQLKLVEAIKQSDEDESILEREYQRELFARAASNIRGEFEDATWQAFWLTSVDGEEIESVAAKLNKQTGSIYAARSRVTRRLREEVSRLLGDEEV